MSDNRSLPPEIIEAAHFSEELALLGHTAWVPDEGPVVAEAETDWTFRVYGGRFSFSSPEQRFSDILDRAALDGLVHGFERAIADGDEFVGMDTALGRYVTSVTAIRRASLGPQRKLARISFNHHHSERCCGKSGWRMLVDEVSSLLHWRLSESGRGVFAFLRSRFAQTTAVESTPLRPRCT
jgi:hypothetical protein